MTKIYFDESGQTGPHLVDEQQPFFCLGSTDLESDEASEILRTCFPSHTKGELKAEKLFKRTTGRKQFLSFASLIGDIPHRVCVAKAHKRFVVVSKMVDNLVEPLVRAAGFDFYKNDYARKFANSAFYAFDHILDRSLGDALLETYNTFARSPSVVTLRTLQSHLMKVALLAPHGADLFVDMMKTGADEFERFHNIENFKDSNEIHVATVLRCMSFWQSKHSGSFDVVHDESMHFFAQSKRWQMMTDPGLAPLTVAVGDKNLSLPISVTTTAAEKSHESASIQVCDLLAGFVSRASSQKSDPKFKNFVLDAINAGIGEISIFPIEAGAEFANGSPEPLSGPDAIDQIILGLVANK